MVKRLARLTPDSDVWVDCSNPGSSAVLLGELHPRVRFTDTFWRLCYEAPSQEPWEVATFVQRAVKDPGVVPRWLAGIELAAQMDIVHVVGGGFINGLWPRHVGLLAASVAAVGRSGGRAVITGQSIWPVAPGAEALVRELVAVGAMPTPADVLAMMLRSDPTRPRLTFSDDAQGPTRGERIELSAKVLGNWANKAGNALQDELDAGAGALVVVAMPVHWRSVYWALAAWSVGATIVLPRDHAAAAAATRHADMVVTDNPSLPGPPLVGASSSAFPCWPGHTPRRPKVSSTTPATWPASATSSTSGTLQVRPPPPCRRR